MQHFGFISPGRPAVEPGHIMGEWGGEGVHLAFLYITYIFIERNISGIKSACRVLTPIT